MGSSAEMPFLDHLEELRWRIIWSLASLVVGVGIGFVIVFNFDLLTWLQGPILPFLNGTKLKVTHPGDGFSILMQAAIIVGLLIALPMILYQVWAFLSPALHKHEKRVGVPVIVGAVFLFVCGAAMAWYLVLPMTLKVLFHFDDKAFDEMITASEYFGFVSSLVLAMGAVFELPIVVLLLSFFGLVTPKFLSRFRRHAVVGSYLVASFITPGDLVISSVALTIPLYLLYELSIALSFLVFRAKQRKRLAEEAEEAMA
ncbi:MAG: Sec-independent protein translocase, TatC subunit [Gemmatimonadetes bacterium]|nr:Sec-independent protein translocase, TatC subunit [Gemmatimonadota bacterium]